MEYNFREIEQKWQHTWAAEKTYHVEADDTKKKFYVLNMFPYPSGPDCTWDTRSDILLQTSMHATNAHAVTTC